MGGKKLEVCSCTESRHLRRALQEILRIATTHTDGTLIDDVAQCGNLADQALRLAPLVGDPGLTTTVKARP